MDRRKKRTSTNQYMMYIEMMENDRIFATGRVPRDGDLSYLQKKWKELSDKLNTCSGGPRLTSDEWRKRLNDWKNTTRCKYRRSVSGEKDITLTALEKRALDLFGTAPNANISSDQLSVHLKSEKDEDGDDEIEHHRTSEAFQKELQAAVEEAIGNDDDDDGMGDEQDEQEDVLSEPIGGNVQTIVVENANYTDDDNNDEQMEFITQRRHTLGNASTTVSTATSAPTTTVTKLINGDIPLKRLRTQAPDQIIYEVKKAPMSHSTHRTITIHNTAAPVHHHLPTASVTAAAGTAAVATATDVLHVGTLPAAGGSANDSIRMLDAREIARQLKRMADIKTEKLKFEIARFKFNNPGFNYNCPTL